MQKFFEIVFFVIDRNVCTEALNQIEICRARCRRYSCTKMLRQLNRECSNAARARVDEDFLPFLQVGSLDQRLLSGQAYQRNGSCFFHGELLGRNRDGIFIHRDEFGEGTDSILGRPCIDLVARLESPYT